MRILLDNCVDQRLAVLLVPHEAIHARQVGWADLSNGHLISAAETANFEVMITVDKNLRYQQSLKNRTISIITLDPVLVQFQHIKLLVPTVLKLLPDLEPGSFVSVCEPD